MIRVSSRSSSVFLSLRSIEPVMASSGRIQPSWAVEEQMIPVDCRPSFYERRVASKSMVWLGKDLLHGQEANSS